MRYPTRRDDILTPTTENQPNHATPAVKWREWLPCLVAVAYFILAGLVFIPYAGIQNDEALFAGPLYGPFPREYRVRMFHTDIPIMLMTYLGTVKTWLFGLIFPIWAPGLWSVRVPMILLAGVSIVLFWRLLDRSIGRTAAWIGCALLAADSSYLLTAVFDWGPVVLQHVLLIGGTLLVVLAVQDESPLKLGWGFALFGLGMWDKALFSWAAGGLIAGTLVVFPRLLRQQLTWRNLGVAVAGFMVGALPLIIYNVRNGFATFAGNARFSTEGFRNKAHILRLTSDGAGLFGYIVKEEWDTAVPSPPRTALERGSLSLRDAVGEHRRGLLTWMLALSLLAAPLWWRRWKPVLFGVVVLAVAWLQMAFTKDAGGAVHHAILLWPFPHFVIAAALGAGAERVRHGRRVALVSVALVCGSNVLVTNQYLSQFIRNGPGLVWTDALGPLSAAVPAQPEQDVFVMDWGMFDTIKMLHRGKIRLWYGADSVREDADRRLLGPMLARRNAVFLTYAPGLEVTPGTADRLKTRAVELGYRPQLLRTVSDRRGGVVFEIWQFAPG